MPATKSDPGLPKQGAPTLYLIIAIKLLKGLVLILFGLGVLTLAGQNLDQRFDELLRWIHLDPEKQFFANLGDKLQTITPGNVRGVGIGTILYSLFSFVEGFGLILRVAWIGWVVVGESIFFVPIEIYEISSGFSRTLLAILLLNIGIVWYLLRNRERLFRHH